MGMVLRKLPVSVLTFLLFCLSVTSMAEEMTLQQKLDARSAEASKMAPPEVLKNYEEAIAEIGNIVDLSKVINVGDKAPDFELSNATGQMVKLSSLLAEGPVVLTWYRGSWCPFCNMQLHEYQKALPDLEAAGAKLVAISPELPDSALTWKEKNELKFEVLSDLGNKVAAEYGVVYDLPPQIRESYSGKGRVNLKEYNGDDSLTLPLGVTYVIGTDGIVSYAFIDTDYRKRAEPSVLVAEVQKLK